MTATFSEAMNPAIVPTLAFAPNPSTTFTNPSGAWSGGNTVYTWTYDVADAGVTVADVDLTVSGGQDVAGNTQVPRTNTDYVDIDTRNPVGAATVNRTMVPGGSPVHEDALVLTVTVTYDEAMNTSTTPTIALQDAGTHWGGQTSLGWTGSTVYRATFTHDGTEEPPLPATAITAYVRTANGSGATDSAGNADVGDDSPTFQIDTRKPRAIATVDRTLVPGGSPVYEGALVLTVTVTYDEAMNTGTMPTITLQNGGTHWGSQTSLGWTGNTVYRATLTHTATEEPSLPATAITAFARVANGSGARDLAGNDDVGDDSPTFDIDTRKPRATVTVDRTIVSGGLPIYEGALVLTATVTYDEAMNTSTAPTVTLQNAGANWGSPTLIGWTGNTVYRVAFTHNGTEEPSLPATAITAFARVTNGSGAKDLAGNADVGDDSPTFQIDTRKPRATVTVNRTLVSGGSPVYEGALVLTVTVTYDEAMNTGTMPTITLQNGGTHWGSQTTLGWTGSTVYRATFTHDGTEEPSLPATAITAFVRTTSGSGARDLAGNDDVGDDSPTFDIDTRKPRATVAVDRTTIAAGSPIYEGALAVTVTVAYDEAMNTATRPTITLPGGGTHWGAQTSLGWTGNTVYRATFTHDGTEEPMPPMPALTALARVLDTSGARDLAGNADVGDDSPVFEIDTRKPEVGPGVSAVAVDTDLVYESDLIQVVIVTFDETMRSDATAEPVITFSAGTWTAGAAGVWSAGDTVWTRTYTLTDNDEEVAGVTVDVTGARDAAGNGQENYAAVPEFTIDTLQPRIVRIDAEGRASCGGFYCSGESDTVVISVTFSEDVVLAAGTFNVTLDVLPGGFDVVYVPAGFLPPEAYPACWNDYTTRQGYVVAAGHNSCDLESTAADWSVGTLTDAAGNLAITGLPPVGSRIKALRDIIVDTTPPQAVEDPGASVAYTYVQPAYLAWHEFVEDRERIVAREGVPIYIDVLTNDLDNCHAGLSVATAEVPAPTYGVTSLFTDGGTGHYPVLPGPCDAKVVRYAPAADYTGPDEFGYTARDCSGNTSDGMVYLYVFPKSTLGSVVPNAFSGVPQSVELSVRDDLLLRISDPGQFTYRFGIPDATEHGVLAWTDGDVVYDVSLGVARLDVTYTSAVAYEGGERFTWSVTDPFEVTEERVESFSVVRPDMTLAPLAPSLRVASAGTGYLVVPAALMEEGGVAAIRVQILGRLGDVLGELEPGAVARALLADPGRGAGVLMLRAAELPQGLLRLLVPIADGVICPVVVEVETGGGL